MEEIEDYTLFPFPEIGKELQDMLNKVNEAIIALSVPRVYCEADSELSGLGLRR